MQVEQLKQAGCERVFVDEGISGAKSERPGYTELLGGLPHRSGPPDLLARRFPRSGVHAATSPQ